MSLPLILTAVSSLPDDSIVDVVVIHKEPVDESHIEVQKLIAADYPEEESIRAIERWVTAHEAITELMREHDPEEILGVAAPVEKEEIPVQHKTNTSVCMYGIQICVAICMFGIQHHLLYSYPVHS